MPIVSIYISKGVTIRAVSAYIQAVPMLTFTFTTAVVILVCGQINDHVSTCARIMAIVRSESNNHRRILSHSCHVVSKDSAGDYQPAMALRKEWVKLRLRKSKNQVEGVDRVTFRGA